MKRTLRQTLDCDAATYWGRVFFDHGYVERLNIEALDAQWFEIVEETTHPDGKIERVTQSGQTREAPGVLKKLVKNKETATTETGVFDPEAQEWSFTITPPQMADKMTIQGRIRLEPGADGGSERVVDVEVDVSLPVGGGQLEKFVVGQMEESYQKGADFTNAYLAEAGPG